MTDPITPDQDTATLALMMEREVDKRVMLALSRALNPSNNWEVREIENAYNDGRPENIQRVVRNMFISAVMSDGSLLSHVKSKLAESLNRY